MTETQAKYITSNVPYKPNPEQMSIYDLAQAVEDGIVPLAHLTKRINKMRGLDAGFAHCKSFIQAGDTDTLTALVNLMEIRWKEFERPQWDKLTPDLSDVIFEP